MLLSLELAGWLARSLACCDGDGRLLSESASKPRVGSSVSGREGESQIEFAGVQIVVRADFFFGVWLVVSVGWIVALGVLGVGLAGEVFSCRSGRSVAGWLLLRIGPARIRMFAGWIIARRTRSLRTDGIWMLQ